MGPPGTTLRRLDLLSLLPAALIILAAFAPPHIHAESWGTALALASLMGALATSRDSSGGGEARPPHATGTWLVGIVAAAIAANIASSIQPLASARTAAIWGAYAFIFVFCRGLRTGDAAEDGWPPGAVVIAAVIAAGTGLALHGLNQSLLGFDPLAQAAGPEASEALRARIASGRAVTTLGLPGALAGFVALSLPLALGWAGRAGSRGVERAIAWSVVLVQAAGLAATRSAAGVLSLALAGAVVVLWRPPEGRSARGRALAALLLFTGLAGAAALMALRLSAGTAPDEGPGPVTLRLGNWNVATAIFAEHPVLGAGAGCYGIAFPQHRTWEMNESRYAHNTFLQLFSEAGIVTGAAALILAAALCAALRRRAGSRRDGWSAHLAVACLSFLLHNLADFTFYLPTVGFAFFSLAGLACGPAERRGAGRPGSRPFMTVAALGLALFGLMVTRADVKKEAARWAVRADPSLAGALAREAVYRNPFDPDSRSIRSQFLFERGMRSGGDQDLAEAEGEARRAVELDPATPHHWHHLGRVRLARKDPLGALVALTRAAQLYPIKIEYRQDRDAVAATLAGNKEPK